MVAPMARKPPNAPRPPALGRHAMARIADLVGRGASPARIDREVAAIVAGLRDATDPEEARALVESLRDEMLAGVADTAEMLEDIEHPDAASVKAADRTLAAMRAACAALVSARAAL